MVTFAILGVLRALLFAERGESLLPGREAGLSRVGHDDDYDAILVRDVLESVYERKSGVIGRRK